MSANLLSIERKHEVALVTLRRALQAQYRRHRQIARVTLPIWLYVVATGWTVYLMLHAA